MSENPRHPGALYSPSDERPPPIVPQWSHTRDRSLSSSRNSSRKTTFGIAKARARRLQRWARKRLKSMTLMQKIVGSLVLLISATLGILTLVFHSQILHAILPFAEKLRSSKAGWILIFVFCFITAFPPIVGYSTSVTLAGFIFGFPNGWFIVAAGTIIGATSAFVACRYFFHEFSKRMVSSDKRFAALSLTLKHDGIKLLCLVRLCPLPYSISNGAISTFPTVTPWAFMLATAVVTPKLMLHVFIGHRLRLLAEADEKMDAKTKALNYCSIIFGLILGVVVGWWIYKRTITRAKQLENEERARLRPSHGPPFSDLDDDADASTAAGLISSLVDGEGLQQAAFGDESDEDSYHDIDDDGTLLGDETDDEEQMIGLEDRSSLERSGTNGKSGNPTA